ncbi:MAG: polyphosphate:AMP phosphotransferase [Sumerlaeia bacterium]
MISTPTPVPELPAEDDPTPQLSKGDYQARFPELKIELRALQQRARELGIPVLVVLSGLGTAGKGDTIRHLTEALDPRGFEVSAFGEPGPCDQGNAWLRRFWLRMPAKGRVAFFERSWYRRVLDEHVDGRVTGPELESAYRSIRETERMLAADGMVVLKFWLHITKKQQRKRLKAAEKDPYRQFTVTDLEWERHHLYDDMMRAARELLTRTHNPESPWLVVDANDKRWRRMKVAEELASALRQAIGRKEADLAGPPPRRYAPPPGETPILSRVNLTHSLSKDGYEKQKVEYQIRLRRLQHRAAQAGVALAVAYEGWDAAGKGGSIRRLTATLDPRGYQVVPISAPSAEEKAHHYLWRFWRHGPRRGHMVIFDRSWHGRILVERIEGFATEAEWRRAYDEINEFERQWWESRVALVKFWIHISPGEQLRRFEARQADSLKQFKMTDEDWRNREKWGLYEAAVEEMVERTSTDYAPWTIVEGECKRHARVQVLRTVCETLEKAIARG